MTCTSTSAARCKYQADLTNAHCAAFQESVLATEKVMHPQLYSPDSQGAEISLQQSRGQQKHCRKAQGIVCEKHPGSGSTSSNY